MTQRLGWITNTVNRSAQAKGARRLDQEVQQLLRTFSVAPVADPDDILTWTIKRFGPENSCIRRFMPREYPSAPAELFIPTAQRFAERQDSVVVIQRQCLDRILVGNAAMVRIVE